MKKTTTSIEKRLHKRLKALNLPKKYSLRELRLLRQLMFEEMLAVMFEDPDGIRIQNFGHFKLVDKYYRSPVFGDGRLHRAKTISFKVSRNFQKVRRKRLKIED